MTYEEVCELALALGVWLESILPSLTTSESSVPVTHLTAADSGGWPMPGSPLQ